MKSMRSKLRRQWQVERKELGLHFTRDEVQRGLHNLDFEVWLELQQEAQAETG